VLARYFREPNTAVDQTRGTESADDRAAARTIDDRHPIDFPSILANSGFNQDTKMSARTWRSVDVPK